MLPDFVVKQLSSYVGNAVGGPLWGTVAAEAAAIAISGAEFLNLYVRLEDGSATRSDVLDAVAAAEAALLGAGIVLTTGGVIAGIGASIPLAVAVVAAGAAAAWYHRNETAVQDSLEVLTDAISRGDQPWNFLPRVWDAYRQEAYQRQVSPQTRAC